MKTHFVYTWSIGNVVFYVGQGKHQPKGKDRTKYRRMWDNHTNRSGVLAACQTYANELRQAGTPHVTTLVADDLTKSEADALERQLVMAHGKLCDGTGTLVNIVDGGNANLSDSLEWRSRCNAAMSTDEYKSKMSDITKKRLNTPETKAIWLAKFQTDAVREKIRAVQAAVNGKQIEWQGTRYRSKKELARTIGISSQLLNFRLQRGIPLDLEPSKSNRRGTDF